MCIKEMFLICPWDKFNVEQGVKYAKLAIFAFQNICLLLSNHDMIETKRCKSIFHKSIHYGLENPQVWPSSTWDTCLIFTCVTWIW